MMIFPALSISTRAMSTPAAATALSARVTSCWRNVEGARDIRPPVRRSECIRDGATPQTPHSFLAAGPSEHYRPGIGRIDVVGPSPANPQQAQQAQQALGPA